jgi:hypothetical protein
MILRWNKHPLLSLFSSHIIEYPTPINLNYMWSFGSAAGICLVIQIITGIFLAMYYTPHIDYAFLSIEFIMRNVNNGWIIRYLHANGASIFFIVVYCHILRGLYFGSYIQPRGLLWMSGVLLLILMMATAFIGYVLPWGQMSFWAFFHSSLSPAPIIGGVWLPVGIEILNLWEIPLFNTILLLSSGALMYSFSLRNLLKQIYGFLTTGKNIFYHKNLNIKNQSFYFGIIRIPPFLDFNDCSLISHLVTSNYDLDDLDECANRIRQCFPIEKEHHAIFQMLDLLENNGLLGEFIRFFEQNHALYKINNIYYLDFMSANLIVFINTQLQFYDFESDNSTQSFFWDKLLPNDFWEYEKKNIKIFYNTLYKLKNLDQFLKLWS